MRTPAHRILFIIRRLANNNNDRFEIVIIIFFLFPLTPDYCPIFILLYSNEIRVRIPGGPRECTFSLGWTSGDAANAGVRGRLLNTLKPNCFILLYKLSGMFGAVEPENTANAFRSRLNRKRVNNNINFVDRSNNRKTVEHDRARTHHNTSRVYTL